MRLPESVMKGASKGEVLAVTNVSRDKLQGAVGGAEAELVNWKECANLVGFALTECEE